MKFNKLFFSIAIIFSCVNIFAQMGGGHHHNNPDSLQTVFVSGVAIVDSTTSMHKMYYIDTDNNGSSNFILNFGPWWYTPDSSTASRPNNGQQITIKGGLSDDEMIMDSMIIVYEIDALFWRDPQNPYWNHFGHQGVNCNHNMDSCYNSGYGWEHDPPTTVDLSGIVFIDSTFMMKQFYLDVNNNGTPDYFLNFGPPWYQPQSGAERPSNGDQVSLIGGLINNGEHPMLIVYQINGLLWRDSTYFMGHMGGTWINKNMTQPKQFHPQFDEYDKITMYPGWNNSGGGGHHGGMQDSLFCQMFETFPGIINNLGSEKAFIAYEVDFFYQGMMGGGMHHNSGCEGHTQFENEADFQFHYSDEQLQLNNIDEQSIIVKYWDSDSNLWTAVSNSVLALNTNTITFSSNIVGNFYILTGDSPTSTDNDGSGISDFKLEQNYPNPFNPSTSIRYRVPDVSQVSLKVYDILGNEIATLVSEEKPRGSYQLQFDASNLSSGIYFYKLRVGSNSVTKKMTLLK